ncbi:N-ATPase subunit AtpR [Paraburkholderia bryophila]|uniref:Uncharacterized protein n=1 Tax=Paraburkholderia bryophila TaxID=420952 RepID=A0A7Y9W4M7_9BURK|nr:ATP synthase subunit I [Paraburkholderia bryophila]NYH14172.1 hypothetical protein [Paraburkholderia bryophila]
MNPHPIDERKAPDDRMAGAARQAAALESRGRAEPKPSLGSRLGQIGILGWAIVLPTLMGLALGTLAGAWHFMSLRWNWPLFAEGRAAAALALQLARFALTGALLFLLARGIAMRRHGGRP